MIARFFALVDAAIEAVIGAAIDVICREWPEETAQAAKEEGQVIHSPESVEHGVKHPGSEVSDA